MDDWFISFLLFVLSFLVYYHVQKQYKTSEDLEIYETDYVSRKELQPTLELKQPVLFSFPTPGISHNDIKDLKTILCIRDIREFYQPDTASVDPILLPMESGRGLLHSDTKHLYFSDCNQYLVDEPLVSYKCSQLDDVLQPPFCSVTKHDVLFGSRKAYTPMTYHTYSQRFLLVQGDSAHCGIRIKMAPWKNTPHLHCRKDYGRFERWSIKEHVPWRRRPVQITRLCGQSWLCVVCTSLLVVHHAIFRRIDLCDIRHLQYRGQCVVERERICSVLLPSTRSL